jgi:hypothetical protein
VLVMSHAHRTKCPPYSKTPNCGCADRHMAAHIVLSEWVPDGRFQLLYIRILNLADVNESYCYRPQTDCEGNDFPVLDAVVDECCP